MPRVKYLMFLITCKNFRIKKMSKGRRAGLHLSVMHVINARREMEV